MRQHESQTIEFKETWQDDHLKTVCAFANTEGGVLYIGVRDNGEVIGIKNAKKLLEDLPNKVINILGIAVNVKVEEESEKQYIRMAVPKNILAVSYHGRFYIRSGSTSQELKGGELQWFLLRTSNMTWDEMIVNDADFDDIDHETVSRFVSRAVEHNRLPKGVDDRDILRLFQNLRLATGAGELTRAAVLLFAQKPTRFFSCATFKIGRFRGTDSTDLVVHDLLESNLFTTFDMVIDLLRSKYLWSPVSYKGMMRVETLEIPDKAIREAVLNAMIHKDYTSLASVMLRVYDPTVQIWNPGKLENLDIADLSIDHGSYPRNPLIAEMFYRAGYIEAWGRGTLTIIDETTKSGLEKPMFENIQGGLAVTFKRNPMLFSENGVRLSIAATTETTSVLKPSERQQKAIDYVREHGSINNTIYQELTGVSKRTATNDLAILVEKLIFVKEGTAGESVKYTLTDGSWAIVGQ